jgi:hypothetical protein
VESGATTIRVTGGDLTDVVFVGRGGHATVYRARQTSLGRNVAVKVLDSTATDDGSLPAEARIQASMSWHANVLTLLGATKVDDGRTALLLEYAPGGSLQEKIQRTGPLPPAEWRQLGAELASALAAAHDTKVLHRDVKPSNVLLAADGSARLADFGLAGPVEDTLRHWAGSVAYSPPELLEGTPADTPNDVYSLVLTLLFAATGKMPFNADKAQPAAVMARIQSERIRFTDKVDGVDPQLAALLDAALDHEPSDRPSARALARTLAQRPGVRTAAPTRGTLDRRRVLLGAMSAVLLVALAATVLVVGAWTRDEASPLTNICENYREFGEARLELLGTVSAEVEQSTSAAEVVERLLVTYPQEWAAAVSPFMRDAAEVSGRPLAATDRQLASLTQADVLRSLSGGQPFAFDGATDSFDESVPAQLRAPAQSFAAASELGAKTCPNDIVDLSAAKARSYSAIYSRLANPEFMASYFEDPRSASVLDVDTVLLMIQVARPLVELLLDGNWDWAFGMSDSSLRTAVAIEAPELVLRAGFAEPELFASSMNAEWQEELQTGYQRLGPETRAGIERLYPEQVDVAGLGDT